MKPKIAVEAPELTPATRAVRCARGVVTAGHAGAGALASRGGSLTGGAELLLRGAAAGIRDRADALGLRVSAGRRRCVRDRLGIGRAGAGTARINGGGRVGGARGAETLGGAVHRFGGVGHRSSSGGPSATCSRM
jgi:hypothetical protein